MSTLVSVDDPTSNRPTIKQLQPAGVMFRLDDDVAVGEKVEWPSHVGLGCCPDADKRKFLIFQPDGGSTCFVHLSDSPRSLLVLPPSLLRSAQR